MDSKIMITVFVLAAFVLAGCTTQQTLAFADDSSPVMYFYSDECSHCQAQKPILVQLAEEGYRVKPMDVLRNPQYWQQYQIQGTPTFLASNGDRLEGTTPAQSLRLWLAQHNAKLK